MFFLDEKRDDEQKVPVLWYAYGRSSCDQVTGDDIHYHNRA